MRYRDLGEVPRRLPKAGVLVHNWVHAQWEDQRPGRNGFRVWTEPKPKTGRPLCQCGWSGLPHYRTTGLGIAGIAAGRDRQAVPGVDARRGCGAAAQVPSRPRRGCGPAKARGATYPRGAVGAGRLPTDERRAPSRPFLSRWPKKLETTKRGHVVILDPLWSEWLVSRRHCARHILHWQRDDPIHVAADQCFSFMSGDGLAVRLARRRR